MSSNSAISVRSDVQALWERRRADVLARIDRLGNATDAVDSAGENSTARREAEREAHRLTGLVGSFGFSEASRLARTVQQELAVDQTLLGPARIEKIKELIQALRDQLIRDDGAATVVLPEGEAHGPVLWVVDADGAADGDLPASIAAQASAYGMAGEIMPSPAAARLRGATNPPDALVVMVDEPSKSRQTLQLVADIVRQAPSVSVLLLARGAGFLDRLEAFRAGARMVLTTAVPPSEILELIQELLHREHEGFDNLLVVDDDPAFLSLVETLLRPYPLRMTALADSRWFWSTLDEVRPDLVLLDLDMPHTTGMELCRALRADPRWAGVPVLMLTASNETNALNEAFAVGADDYVIKPIVGPELTTRITNRLERVRLYRELAATDPLTGLANRREFNKELARLMGIATRYNQPLSFVLLDLDDFKGVNDRYGHAVGDEVLERLGHSLLEMFRGEDAVARWGGEEFALALLGMSRADGVQRVADALARFRRETFRGPDNEHFAVTFSGGVAQFPEDGREVHELYQVADDALLGAKAARGHGVIKAAGRVGVSDGEHGPAGCD